MADVGFNFFGGIRFNLVDEEFSRAMQSLRDSVTPSKDIASISTGNVADDDESVNTSDLATSLFRASDDVGCLFVCDYDAKLSAGQKFFYVLLLLVTFGFYQRSIRMGTQRLVEAVKAGGAADDVRRILVEILGESNRGAIGDIVKDGNIEAVVECANVSGAVAVLGNKFDSLFVAANKESVDGTKPKFNRAFELLAFAACAKADNLSEAIDAVGAADDARGIAEALNKLTDGEAQVFKAKGGAECDDLEAHKAEIVNLLKFIHADFELAKVMDWRAARIAAAEKIFNLAEWKSLVGNAGADTYYAADIIRNSRGAHAAATEIAEKIKTLIGDGGIYEGKLALKSAPNEELVADSITVELIIESIAEYVRSQYEKLAKEDAIHDSFYWNIAGRPGSLGEFLGVIGLTLKGGEENVRTSRPSLTEYILTCGGPLVLHVSSSCARAITAVKVKDGKTAKTLIDGEVAEAKDSAKREAAEAIKALMGRKPAASAEAPEESGGS